MVSNMVRPVMTSVVTTDYVSGILSPDLYCDNVNGILSPDTVLIHQYKVTVICFVLL